MGILFAALASVSIGLNAVTARRGVLRASALQGVYITVFLGLPLFLVATAASGQFLRASALSPVGYLVLAGAGVLHFLVGRYCIYRATSAIGANRASPIHAMSMPYSVLVALVFLDEQVSVVNTVGIALMLFGPAIIIERPTPPRQKAPASSAAPLSSPAAGPPSAASAPSPGTQAATAPGQSAPPLVTRQAEGYFFAVLSGLAQGTSPILVRAVLAGNSVGVLGGLISYTAAAGVLGLSLLLPGRLAALQSVDRTAAKWFFASGVFVSLGQMFRYMALSIAPVSVVTPLQRTSVLFTLFFSFLINRKTESFSPRVLAGIALSVIGALALTR